MAVRANLGCMDISCDDQRCNLLGRPFAGLEPDNRGRLSAMNSYLGRKAWDGGGFYFAWKRATLNG